MTAQSSQVVDILMKSGALKIAPDKPFRLASGLLSPFYIDCRLILSNPQGLSIIADMMAEQIREKKGLDGFDVIAGGVTAGVPFATLVAERLQKPLVYIRPEPKKHGSGSQIEGGDVKGKRVLLIEDLITRASSAQKFHAALYNAGASMAGLFVILSRADAVATLHLREMNLDLSCLVTVDDIVTSLASTSGQQETAEIMKNFISNPDAWSASQSA